MLFGQFWKLKSCHLKRSTSADLGESGGWSVVIWGRSWGVSWVLFPSNFGFSVQFCYIRIGGDICVVGKIGRKMYGVGYGGDYGGGYKKVIDKKAKK